MGWGGIHKRGARFDMEADIRPTSDSQKVHVELELKCRKVAFLSWILWANDIAASPVVIDVAGDGDL